MNEWKHDEMLKLIVKPPIGRVITYRRQVLMGEMPKTWQGVMLMIDHMSGYVSQIL